MQHRTKPFIRWALIICAILLVLSCMLMGRIPLPNSERARRLAAEERWATRPFSSYRLVQRVEYLNQICLQAIEVREEQVQKVLTGTCQPGPFSLLTVRRLFEFSQRLELSPLCYADSPCVCQLHPNGKVSYDRQLGYPVEIVYQPTIEQNWGHPDFWIRMWQIKGKPSCGSGSPESLRFSVTSLIPLP